MENKKLRNLILIDDRTERIISSLPEQEKKYEYLIEQEVYNSGFNPHTKPPATLTEAIKVMKTVNILKIWDKNSNYKSRIERISSDIDGEAVTFSEGTGITINPIAFSSYANLALVIGHELQHVYYYSLKEEDKEGIKYWRKLGEEHFGKTSKKDDFVKACSEYKAWLWTWTYVNKKKYAYGVYERYISWEKKYKAFGINI